MEATVLEPSLIGAAPEIGLGTAGVSATVSSMSAATGEAVRSLTGLEIVGIIALFYVGYRLLFGKKNS